MAQEENGHFAYEYAPYEGKYLTGDNIVRQAGALYALGEVYRRSEDPRAVLEDGIEQAVSYFESLSVEAQGEGRNTESFVCIASTSQKASCKLGATALALTGLLSYVEDNPTRAKKYDELIEGYISFIILSQKNAGGFRDLYHVGDGFVDKESPYSNGEALLALVRAYQYQGDADVKRAIDSAFAYLKTTPHVNPLYLWIMAALKDMQELWPKEEYITYARDFTAWRVATGVYEKKNHNYCPFVEGLASAYGVLDAAPKQGELLKLRTTIDSWLDYIETLQVDESDAYKVVFDEKGAPSLAKLAEPSRAHGGFLTAHSVPTQRIDFTQHCITAYVQTLVDIGEYDL
jgi:hypothetical protein